MTVFGFVVGAIVAANKGNLLAALLHQFLCCQLSSGLVVGGNTGYIFIVIGPIDTDKWNVRCEVVLNWTICNRNDAIHLILLQHGDIFNLFLVPINIAKQEFITLLTQFIFNIVRKLCEKWVPNSWNNESNCLRFIDFHSTSIGIWYIVQLFDGLLDLFQRHLLDSAFIIHHPRNSSHSHSCQTGNIFHGHGFFDFFHFLTSLLLTILA